MKRKPDLDEELEKLAQRLPNWAARFVRWVRKPSAQMFRVPLAIFLVLGGVVGFLPILGFWMVPLGLVLIADDLPFLRGPIARLLAFINRKLAA